MRKQFVDKWLTPALCNPKTSIACAAAVAAIFLPEYADKITKIALAVGLLFAGDAKQC